MSVFTEFPVARVREVIRTLNDRCRMKSAGKTVAGWAELALTIDEARYFCAAKPWLEMFDTTGSSIQKTRVTIKDCIFFVEEKKEEMKFQKEEKFLRLDPKDMRAMLDVERHLDQLTILKEGDEIQKKRGKRK